MTFDSIIRDINNKIFHPIYFYYGEEPFYTDKLVKYMEDHVLTEAEKSFNCTVLYGKDASVEQIVDSASRLPMMASHNLVILKEAQQMHHKTFETLESYIAKPVSTTIFVIAYKYKKPDKRKNFFKLLLKQSIAHESPLVKEHQVEGWISKHVSSKGFTVNHDGTRLIAENIGNNLHRIDHELDKLIINKGEDKKITVDDIEKYIGLSKENNVFELNKALGNKDITQANKILNNFSLNPKNHPMPLLMAAMFTYFQKVHQVYYFKSLNDRALAGVLKVPPYYVKDYTTAAGNYSRKSVEEIIHMLQEYDLKYKGSGSKIRDHIELLKELTFKIYQKR